MAGGKGRSRERRPAGSWPAVLPPTLPQACSRVAGLLTILTTLSVKASVHLISPGPLVHGFQSRLARSWTGAQGWSIVGMLSEWVWAAMPVNSSAADIIPLVVKSWAHGDRDILSVM